MYRTNLKQLIIKNQPITNKNSLSKPGVIELIVPLFTCTLLRFTVYYTKPERVPLKFTL